MSVNKWATAVRALLAAGDLSQKDLADALGVTPAALSYYLRAQRSVPESIVRKANRWLSVTLRIPSVNEYLLALALEGGLLGGVEAEDVSFAATIALLRDLDCYFVHGAQHAVQAVFALAQLDEQRFAAVFLELSALRGRRALAALSGHDRAEPVIDDVLRVFAAHGLSLDAWVRRDREAARARARDIFAQSVTRELGHIDALTLQQRTAISTAIVAHYESALERIDSSSVTMADKILTPGPRRRVPRRKSQRGSNEN